MKYIVEVKYTNPAHEHVSLRRRVDTINRVVEARNEKEALNRVANQQRALGFLVREAKVIEETVQTSKGVAKEEVEQTDEALLPKQQAVADKLKASELAANKEKAGYKFGKGLRAAKVAAKMKVNEVVDEKEPTKGKKAASKMTQKAAELRKDKIKGSANKVNMKPEVDLNLKGI